MTTSRTKDEITMRGDYPAINIKVYTYVNAQVIDEVNREEGYALTEEWVDEQLDADHGADWFMAACESEWDYFSQWVIEIFEDYYAVSLYTEGQQGGWAVVHGLPPVDEWDAVLLAKWRKCERVAREIADGIPYQIVSLIAMNVWEPEQEDVQEDRDAAASEGVMA